MKFKPTDDARSITVGFKSKKAAQIAAFFASKSGVHIEKLKLIKLIYLSEREFLERYDQPMIYDEFYSLEHGPICSNALNGINGLIDQKTWSTYITLRDVKNVIPNKSFTRDDLDELSDAEMEIIGSIWETFKSMSSSEIRRWTHVNCPEYKEVPAGNSLPIYYKDLLEAVGCQDIEETVNAVSEARRVSGILAV